MTTATKPSHFSSAPHLSEIDFVSSDSSALATHMNRCEKGRSRFFGFYAVGELAHSMIFSRMVTCAVIAVVGLGILDLIGVV